MASRPAPIEIDPALLRWARESIGLSVEAAAKKARVAKRKLDLWESERALPSPRQLEKFAATYKRPVATFFLPEPPQEPPLPADFRVVQTDEPPTLSPNSIVAIRRARRLGEIYAELSGPDERGPRIRLSANQPPEDSARRIRADLGVTIAEQLDFETDDASLRVWRSAVERLGVLVFQFGFPVREMRGFSLSNGGTPAVVLNNRDGYRPRNFTLFHELAHVLLGKPGICNPDGRMRVKQHDDVEAFCNAFAAEVLVPMAEFRSSAPVQTFRRGRAELEPTLKEAAEAFRVSSHVILRRLLTAQLISQGQYQKMVAEWDKRAPSWERVSRKKAKGGPAPSRKALSEIGAPFITRALRARDAGVIGDSDLTDYLSVGMKHVEKIQALLPAS